MIWCSHISQQTCKVGPTSCKWVGFDGKLVGKYTTYMYPMGDSPQFWMIEIFYKGGPS